MAAYLMLPFVLLLLLLLAGVLFLIRKRLPWARRPVRNVPPAIVRRYRAAPSPLVRDSVPAGARGGWTVCWQGSST